MPDAITVLENNRVITHVAGAGLLEPLIAQTAVYRDAAAVSAAVALSAAGPNYASTAAGLAATAEGGSFAVDNGDGTVTVYREVSGSAVAQRTLATTAFIANTYVSKAGAETITNKTFGGDAPFLMDGGRAIFTSADALPESPVGLVHIQNSNAQNVGLFVVSYWEGATGNAYTNNDTTLFVTYNTTHSNSDNRSWSFSSSNTANGIPLGVRDGGSRAGGIGWASTVAQDGYLQYGTLAEQYGLRGVVGFQGAGTPSSAVVENAIGIEGLVLADSVGATIELAIAGRFLTDGGVGIVEDNYAIYARATNGTVSNYSFYGAAGALYNVDPIVTDDYVRGEQYLLGAAVALDKDGSNNRVYRGDGDIGLWLGAGESLHGNVVHRFTGTGGAGYFAIIDADGVTADAFNLGSAVFADFDGANNRVRTQGGNIAMYLSDAESAYAAPQHRFGSVSLAADYVIIDPNGIWVDLTTFADNAAAVTGLLDVNQLYATATGEVRIVV